MLTSWHTILEIALRTSVVYVLVLVGIRLTGKREVGQMTPFDLTLLLLLSNSVQNAMTGPDTSLAGGAVAALVLLTLNFLLAEVSGMNRRFRKMGHFRIVRLFLRTALNTWNDSFFLRDHKYWHSEA